LTTKTRVLVFPKATWQILAGGVSIQKAAARGLVMPVPVVNSKSGKRKSGFCIP
jgi:hypothetical protein